jgi:hypothetical protein
VFADRCMKSRRATRSGLPAWPALLILLALTALLGQHTMALSIQPAQTWAGGLYDDAPHADTPAVPPAITLPPGIASCPRDASVVGRVIVAPDLRPASAPLESSLGRAPPLA